VNALRGKLAPDPLDDGGMAGFGVRLRAGAISAESATQAYLQRIASLDNKLKAYEHVAAEAALVQARAIDRLLASGVDLGPLMGVPVSVKDLFKIEGMPVYAGSTIDVSDVIGNEGAFIRSLKQAGCVILGTVKTPEFAMGSAGLGGVTVLRGTPWNPWDPAVHRAPGVSSSGSAVAVAAGLCAFSIGTDTGGSVRLPSAYCGVFGLKTSSGRFPADGMFPQARNLDSIGPLTRSAADAALVFSALTGTPTISARSPRTLRLGKLDGGYFYADLQPIVGATIERALAALANAGAEIVPASFPEAREAKDRFGRYVNAELISVIGRERFMRERPRMDPIVAPRVAAALDVTGDEYCALEMRRRELGSIAIERMADMDAWVLPTAAMVAPAMRDTDGKDPAELNRLLASRTTHRRVFANVCNLAATSTPVHQLGADLPVGLQIVCRPFAEAEALSIAMAVEQIIGQPMRPDLQAFL
jgi:aspartyl-tRNA(Asn)/glutamyl-tRNA(Gln) amidotransferase subunit A